MRPGGAAREWRELGYFPNDRCYPAGGAKARERFKAGNCVWTATTCQGEIARCERCKAPFCAYHFHLHEVGVHR